MSILIHKDTKVIVQGITGRAARFHTEQMQAYGTNIVGGTAPGKAGQVCCGCYRRQCIRHFRAGSLCS